MPEVTGKAKSLFDTLDDAELSERKIGCRSCKGACISRKRRETPNPHAYHELANALQILPPHSIHRVTEALERLEEDAAADRPFIAALAIRSKARGTSHKPYTLLTAFDRPHILIGKSEMMTNFMHQNMCNNRIQRDLTSRPKIEDRIPIEKNPIGQVSGRRILCLKLGTTVKCTQNTEFVF